MSLKDRSQRAERARQLLEDPLLQEAFAQVRGDALNRFADSRHEESSVREAAYYEIQALENVQSALKSVMLDARLKNHDHKG